MRQRKKDSAGAVRAPRERRVRAGEALERLRAGEPAPQRAIPTPFLPEAAVRAERTPALDALMLWLSGSEAEGRTLFLRARHHEDLPAGVVAQQTLKRLYEGLVSAGVETVLEASGEFDLCLYLGTNQREENLANFGLGLSLLRPGGLFVCAMPNDLGAARYEKALKEAGPLEVQFSKYHSRVFGIRRPVDEALVADWRARGAWRRSEASGLWTRPGLFGWDKVDEGSRLLAESLPGRMPGAGADLGAGYGYLAHSLLSRDRGVARLDLFEAERLALDAARRNLEEQGSGVPVGYHWQDVTEGLPTEMYDWIVMNPPFHVGRSRSLGLGTTFVQRAAQALRPQGVLHMVANRNLPYEPELRKVLGNVETVADNGGFKVLRARR